MTGMPPAVVKWVEKPPPGKYSRVAAWKVEAFRSASMSASVISHQCLMMGLPSASFSSPVALRVVAATRLNFVAGQGPVLQISEGWTVELPDDVRDQIVNRTDPTWPTTFFVPRLTGEGAFTSVYDWMANWGANHTATGYGHFGADLITLASMLRIPVYMHNVERERILRPKAWVPFGTAEPESADFRACATFGPLYR